MASSLLAGLSILLIGDSHLATPEYLIGSLHNELLAKGAKVHSLGICGAQAGDWLKVSAAGTCGGAERKGSAKAVVLRGKAATQPIAELIASEKPDLVLVVLGDTMAGYTQANFQRAWVWQQTTKLVKSIASTGTQCAWVGPNWGSEGGKYGKTYARVEQIATLLSTNVAPCGFIDSLKLSKKGQWATVDGQHLTATGYKQWGAGIAGALESWKGQVQ
jgi:hypothetical protein